MPLAQGEPSHQTEPSRTTPWLDETGPVNRLAEDLALTLGCPVVVMYLEDTREVLAVAQPQPGREVRVTLPVAPLAIRLMDNPFAALKYDLIKQLRYQMSQEAD